jgi:predicted alpha/beta superfamily hydrolase
MDEITQEQNLNQGQSATSPISGEAADFQLHPFQSTIFRNSRMLRIWLPPGYHAKENQERHYPVFYLNDGQNLFDPATSFTGVAWRVGQTAEALIREGRIPSLIIVGIDNAQEQRLKEYLPYRSFNPTVLRPRGKRYPEFLLSEVMPFVDQRFRIAQGPENTGLGGSSLGGLIALFTVLDRPGAFGRLLVESPSLFVSNRRILKYSRYFKQWPDRVYLGIGTKESGREDKDQQFVNDLRELEQIMRRSGLGDDRLRVWIDEGASHNEGEWAKRLPEALAFLFSNG